MTRAGRFELLGYLGAEAGLTWRELAEHAEDLGRRLGCDVDWPAVHDGWDRALYRARS